MGGYVMKLQNIQEVEEFRKVVHQCKGRVYLESLEGDILRGEDPLLFSWHKKVKSLLKGH